MASATTPSELWLPGRYSLPLTLDENFTSHGDWLLRLVDMVWRLPDGTKIVLDPWQRWLIRHILETYPPGHPRAGRLRYRRVVVSMARQNGKSVLGAIFGLYGLVREAGALVIGLASSADQARIIYSRLLAVINSNPDLAKRFERLTDTRGITGKDNSRYEIKAAKSAAVQGLDISVGLADELHIMPAALWSDMVNGTKARKNGIVIGITTAGDEESTLLKDLYTKMETPAERYGYFVWEAPEGKVPDDDKTLGEYLIAANPALASGRLDLEETIDSVRSMPPPDAIRYNLNRFVASSNSFMGLHLWAACQGTLEAPVRPVIAIDRTPDWSAATITANWRAADGKIHTEVVSSFVRPSLERLEAACVALSKISPILYVGDGYTMRGLMENLKARGLTVRTATQADIQGCSSLFYAKVVQQKIVHPGDPLMSVQLPKTTRKNSGDGFRITRLPGAEIDTVMATAIGVYFADITKDQGSQLFL